MTDKQLKVLLMALAENARSTLEKMKGCESLDVPTGTKPRWKGDGDRPVWGFTENPTDWEMVPDYTSPRTGEHFMIEHIALIESLMEELETK